MRKTTGKNMAKEVNNERGKQKAGDNRQATNATGGEMARSTQRKALETQIRAETRSLRKPSDEKEV